MAASHAAACLLLPLASSPAISLSCAAASAPGTVYCRNMPVARVLPAGGERRCLPCVLLRKQPLLETCDPVCREGEGIPTARINYLPITENRMVTWSSSPTVQRLPAMLLPTSEKQHTGRHTHKLEQSSGSTDVLQGRPGYQISQADRYIRSGSADS